MPASRCRSPFGLTRPGPSRSTSFPGRWLLDLAAGQCRCRSDRVLHHLELGGGLRVVLAHAQDATCSRLSTSRSQRGFSCKEHSPGLCAYTCRSESLVKLRPRRARSGTRRHIRTQSTQMFRTSAGTSTVLAVADLTHNDATPGPIPTVGSPSRSSPSMAVLVASERLEGQWSVTRRLPSARCVNANLRSFERPVGRPRPVPRRLPADLRLSMRTFGRVGHGVAHLNAIWSRKRVRESKPLLHASCRAVGDEHREPRRVDRYDLLLPLLAPTRPGMPSEAPPVMRTSRPLYSIGNVGDLVYPLGPVRSVTVPLGSEEIVA